MVDGTLYLYSHDEANAYTPADHHITHGAFMTYCNPIKIFQTIFFLTVIGFMAACGGGNEGGGGPGIGVVPVAVADSGYSTDQLDPIIIPVLDNDSGLDDTPLVVDIFEFASNGSADVLANNRIQYTPNSSKLGSDSFTYRVTDIDGDIAIAKVSIEVTCASCVTDVILTLNWDANPVEENILGYNLYYGDLMNTNALFKRLTGSDIDLSTPSLDIGAGAELMLENGDTICFQVSAYNSAGESEKSLAACDTI